MKQIDGDPLEHRPKITPRQLELLKWMVYGKTNPQIATILGIKPRTVDNLCETLYARLDLEGRADAIREAVRNRWIEFD